MMIRLRRQHSVMRFPGPQKHMPANTENRTASVLAGTAKLFANHIPPSSTSSLGQARFQQWRNCTSPICHRIPSNRHTSAHTTLCAIPAVMPKRVSKPLSWTEHIKKPAPKQERRASLNQSGTIIITTMLGDTPCTCLSTILTEFLWAMEAVARVSILQIRVP